LKGLGDTEVDTTRASMVAPSRAKRRAPVRCIPSMFLKQGVGAFGTWAQGFRLPWVLMCVVAGPWEARAVRGQHLQLDSHARR
jgi:hypothetical protein